MQIIEDGNQREVEEENGKITCDKVVDHAEEVKQ